MGTLSWAQDVVARGVGAAGKNTARRITTRRQARNSQTQKTVIRRRVVLARRASNRTSTVEAAARHIVLSGGDFSRDVLHKLFNHAPKVRGMAHRVKELPVINPDIVAYLLNSQFYIGGEWNNRS